MAEGRRPEPPRSEVHATSFLRSIGEGVRTIVTITERLNDLRADTKGLYQEVRDLATALSEHKGRLDGIDHRFIELDKRIELAVKVAVREELERQERDRRG